MKITAVLLVEEVEKSLPFWVDRLGFEKTIDVPDGNRLSFAILVRDGAEVMLQTIASARRDAPVFTPEGSASRTSLFIEIEDFADVLKRLEGYPIALAEHTTFYGMREIGVIEPGGHNVIFAARV
jgi:hypothetical protein